MAPKLYSSDILDIKVPTLVLQPNTLCLYSLGSKLNVKKFHNKQYMLFV